jgi:hypothetical protein
MRHRMIPLSLLAIPAGDFLPLAAGNEWTLTRYTVKGL